MTIQFCHLRCVKDKLGTATKKISRPKGTFCTAGVILQKFFYRFKISSNIYPIKLAKTKNNIKYFKATTLNWINSTNYFSTHIFLDKTKGKISWSRAFYKSFGVFFNQDNPVFEIILPQIEFSSVSLICTCDNSRYYFHVY